MIKMILPYIQGVCVVAILGALAYLIWRRNKVKCVTLKEIVLWANEHKNEGTNIFICKISVLPPEQKKHVLREISSKKILNGYKDDTSVMAFVTDADKQIVTSWYFLGNKLDEELLITLGDNISINIEL